jgi:hypothetical protein
MPIVKVTITGAEDAVFIWDAKQRALANMGKKWTGALKSASGRHYYRIKVEGNPGDPWTGKVEDPVHSQDNDGEMNENRRDQTGERRFDVA